MLVSLTNSSSVESPNFCIETKNAKFCCSRYMPILAKSQKLKITGTEYKIMMNTVSKGNPLIRYILGDMISPS